MAVAFVSASGGSSLATALPAGHATGHVLLAEVTTEQNGTTPTAATGWTLIDGNPTCSVAGRPLSSHWYWIARGGSAPAVNWSTGGASAEQVGYLCYSGVDNTTPIDGYAKNTDGGGGSSTVNWATFTSASAGSLILGMCGVNDWQNGTVAVWANERFDGGATDSQHFYDHGVQAAGSQSSKSETIGAGWHSIQLALKDAGGGGGASAIDVPALIVPTPAVVRSYYW